MLRRYPAHGLKKVQPVDMVKKVSLQSHLEPAAESILKGRKQLIGAMPRCGGWQPGFPIIH